MGQDWTNWSVLNRNYRREQVKLPTSVYEKIKNKKTAEINRNALY